MIKIKKSACNDLSWPREPDLHHKKSASDGTSTFYSKIQIAACYFLITIYISLEEVVKHR